MNKRNCGPRVRASWQHCVVSLSMNINPSLVLVQLRKTRPYITERLLMGRKESNQTNKTRGTDMSVIVLLNLFNELGKRDKMRGAKHFINFSEQNNHTGTQMLAFIYYMT